MWQKLRLNDTNKMLHQKKLRPSFIYNMLIKVNLPTIVDTPNQSM
ncbi:MAG: hypothetical protein RSB59_03270 [Clostridia bacterium]